MLTYHMESKTCKHTLGMLVFVSSRLRYYKEPSTLLRTYISTVDCYLYSFSQTMKSFAIHNYYTQYTWNIVIKLEICTCDHTMKYSSQYKTNKCWNYCMGLLHVQIILGVRVPHDNLHINYPVIQLNF